MVSSLAVLLSGALALTAALHAYWVVGGRWGSGAVIPTRPTTSETSAGPTVFTPGPFATDVVAVLLGTAALVPLAASGMISVPVPAAIVRIGIWSLAMVLLARAVGDFRYVGLMKRVRGTPFARFDTQLYTPLCLALSALAFGVAIGSA